MSSPSDGFVMDCSLTMTWCFQDESTPETVSLMESLEEMQAHVTTHWPLEVANVLRSSERRGRLTEADADFFLSTLRVLPIVIDRATPDYAWDEIMQLARAHILTPYDAAYLELALRLGLPLATLDKELRLAAQTLSVPLL